MKFMILDDSVTMRKIVELALKMGQYECIEAVNGQDALNKLSSQKVDFFIVDYNMPVMNGIEFLKQIRSKPDYLKTPVVMLTTESDEKMIAEAKQVGANAWIIKPFKNEDLLNLIKAISS